MRIGIIGSSQNESKTAETYEKAVEAVKREIEKLKVPYDQVTLVSGGSSWADHIAVTLFLQLESQGLKLRLYIPCEMTDLGFTNNYFGRELNLRHRAFSEICLPFLGTHSLNQLVDLKKVSNPNVKIVVDFKGFKSRNTLIATHADYLIAVSNTDKVSGGTKDTWDKFDKGDAFRKLLHFE